MLVTFTTQICPRSFCHQWMDLVSQQVSLESFAHDSIAEEHSHNTQTCTGRASLLYFCKQHYHCYLPHFSFLANLYKFITQLLKLPGHHIILLVPLPYTFLLSKPCLSSDENHTWEGTHRKSPQALSTLDSHFWFETKTTCHKILQFSDKEILSHFPVSTLS